MSGITHTDIGEVTIIGVCIPWSGSRVGPRWNRKTWQDHEEYLDGLAELLKRAPRARAVVVEISTSGSGSAVQRRFACVRPASPPYRRTC